MPITKLPKEAPISPEALIKAKRLIPAAGSNREATVMNPGQTRLTENLVKAQARSPSKALLVIGAVK